MRSLVILAFLGCACAAPFLQDTPEVVAERARFTQLFNAQAAAAAAAPDDPVSYNPAPRQAAPVSHTFTQQSAPSTFSHHNAPATFTSAWRGPVATNIPAGLPGSSPQVADTADVSAARDAFLAAYRAQVTATTGQKFSAPVHTVHSNSIVPSQAPIMRWVGPVAATIPAGVDGTVTPVGETAEVAAARNAFNAAYARAVAASNPKTSAHAPRAPARAPVFHAPSHHMPATFSSMPHLVKHEVQPRWMGPVATNVPAGLPGAVSQVSDTAEVAAATHAFQLAYNAAVTATTGRRF